MLLLVLIVIRSSHFLFLLVFIISPLLLCDCVHSFFQCLIQFGSVRFVCLILNANSLRLIQQTFSRPAFCFVFECSYERLPFMRFLFVLLSNKEGNENKRLTATSPAVAVSRRWLFCFVFSLFLALVQMIINCC